MNESLEDVIVKNTFPPVYTVTYFVKNGGVKPYEFSLIETETRSLFKMLGFNDYDSVLIFFRFTDDKKYGSY